MLKMIFYLFILLAFDYNAYKTKVSVMQKLQKKNI